MVNLETHSSLISIEVVCLSFQCTLNRNCLRWLITSKLCKQHICTSQLIIRTTNCFKTNWTKINLSRISNNLTSNSNSNSIKKVIRFTSTWTKTLKVLLNRTIILRTSLWTKRISPTTCNLHSIKTSNKWTSQIKHLHRTTNKTW